MKKRNIIIHSFVYAGDADIIKETILCALQALPEARMVIIDDENKPCPSETRKEIEDMGVEWRTTSWSRGGNLRGKPCITGILSEMTTSATSDDDILIKIDADTCLMDGDDIRKFIADDEKVICASGVMEARVYGCCYCLKAHAAHKVLEYINKLEIPSIAGEDIVIGFSVGNLYPAPEQHMLFPTDVKGTKWTAYHWWYYPDTKRYNGASMITVGNRPPEPLGKKHRRNIMKNLRLQAASFIKTKPECAKISN